MFDPPIDNWTQADEDCFECKHRLALGDELTKLQAELARAHETIARLNRRCQSSECGLLAIEHDIEVGP